jgi:hypothetical protein
MSFLEIQEIWRLWQEGLITQQERNVKIMALCLADIGNESQRCYQKIRTLEKKNE